MSRLVCLQYFAVNVTIERVLSALYFYRKLLLIFMKVFLLGKKQVKMCRVAVAVYLASGCCSWTALLAD